MILGDVSCEKARHVAYCFLDPLRIFVHLCNIFEHLSGASTLQITAPKNFALGATRLLKHLVPDISLVFQQAFKDVKLVTNVFDQHKEVNIIENRVIRALLILIRI
jgi:hypothetical protein